MLASLARPLRSNLSRAVGSGSSKSFLGAHVRPFGGFGARMISSSPVFPSSPGSSTAASTSPPDPPVFMKPTWLESPVSMGTPASSSPLGVKPQCPSKWPGLYKNLSKARLAVLVCSTTALGFGMAPMPGLMEAIPLVTGTMVGTGLCVASANSFNQWREIPFDQQMTRTRLRVLPTRTMSPLHSFSFAVGSGITGTALLAAAANPLTAALGAFNIFLYAGVYTPLKRRSAFNTWPGALVGAIPPIMGWTAVTGSLDLEALWMGWMLYAWQFPHFFALAWNIRKDYAIAGYRMLTVTDPKKAAKYSLYYAGMQFPVSVALTATGMVQPWFLVPATIINGAFFSQAWKFYKDPSAESARVLFKGSLYYLPAIIIAMGVTRVMAHKRNGGDKEEIEESVVTPGDVLALPSTAI